MESTEGKKRKRDEDADVDESILDSESDGDKPVEMDVCESLDKLQIISDGEDESSVNKRGLSLRPYQEELTKTANEGINTIVCAGTGAGKTRIAFSVIKSHLDKNDKGKVAILAPTVPLVNQHYLALREFLPDFEKRTLKVTGESEKSEQLHMFITEYDVFIITPAIIDNTISSGKHKKLLTEFTLIVFDECHHACKGHDYNKIMINYHMEKDRGEKKLPQILGLTATLGTNRANDEDKALVHIINVMANLDVTELSTVRENKEDYKKYNKDITNDKKTLKETPHDNVHKAIEEAMISTEKQLRDVKERLRCDQEHEKNLIGVINRRHERNSKSYIQWATELQDKCTPLLKIREKDAQIVRYCGEYLKIFSLLLEINEALTGKETLKSLQNHMEERHMEKKMEDATCIESKFCTDAENLRKRIKSCLGEKKTVKTHIEELLETIKEGVGESIDEDSRFIIFVKTKEVAQRLSNVLNESGYKTLPFTGTTGIAGTSQSDQLLILDRFKAGDIQGIVATTVAEEGIDIPDCNFVISYNYTGNEISSKQATGRVRQKKGRKVVLGKRKDIDRETVNVARALLMDQALENIISMEQKLLHNQISKIQKEIVTDEKLRQLDDENKQQKTEDNTQYMLSCKCGQFEIDCTSLRVVEKQNYAVLDASIWYRIREYPMAKKLFSKGGMSQVCEWGHDGCTTTLGTVYKYRHVRLPFLAQAALSFCKKGDQHPQMLKKWKNLPCNVPEIESDELLEYAKKMKENRKSNN